MNCNDTDEVNIDDVRSPGGKNCRKSKEKYDKEISIVYKFLKLLSKNKITSYSFLKQRWMREQF